jgi:hypothetical protein
MIRKSIATALKTSAVAFLLVMCNGTANLQVTALRLHAVFMEHKQ